MNDLKFYTQKNKEAWNEVMPLHQKARSETYYQKFADQNFLHLDDIEKEKLLEIGLKGKNVAQLCCNNGAAVISLVKLGAESGIGFDISDEAIKEAGKIAKKATTNCTFICTDIYDIAEKFYNEFDLIYISAGTLGWMPDIDKFFEITSKLLKQNGRLFIYEIHPFVETFSYPGEATFDENNPTKIENSYFRTEPFIDSGSLDYVGNSEYKSQTNEYWFVHTISAILNAATKAGIMIQEFHEYAHDISEILGHIDENRKIPKCYILIGERK